MSEVVTFRRTLGSRIVSAAVCLITGSLLVSFLVGGGTPLFSWLLVGTFFLASLWLNIANFGDRIFLNDEGISIQNLFLDRCGRKPRCMAWEDVEALRQHKKRALFLIPAKGRSLVLDYIDDQDGLARLVQLRTGLTLPPPRPGEDGSDWPVIEE